MNRPLPDASPDDADLAAAIDASFGDGPPAPSLDGLLLAGRRARRRRTTTRAAIGGAVAAGVLAAAGASTGTWDLTGAADGSSGVATTPSSIPPATSPSTGPSTEPSSEPSSESEARELGIRFGPEGQLRVKESTVLVRRLVSPLPDAADERSYAVEVEVDGRRYYALVEWTPTGEMISSDPAGKSFVDLEDWTSYQVEAITGRERDLVRLEPDGTLVAAAGIELVAQVRDVELGPRFAAPGDRTAAAEVLDGNRRWYVLVRDSAVGTPDYIKVDPAATAPTFQGFLDVAADIYSGRSEDSGEGLR